MSGYLGASVVTGRLSIPCTSPPRLVWKLYRQCRQKYTQVLAVGFRFFSSGFEIIAESELSAKDNEMLVAAINRHWEFINNQITKTFNGEKTIAIDIEK